MWVPYFEDCSFKIETSIQRSTRSIWKYAFQASKPYQELLHWIKIEGVMIDQSWDVTRHFCPASLVMCVLVRREFWQTLGMHQVSMFMANFINDTSFKLKSCQHQSCSFPSPLQLSCWRFFHVINGWRDKWDQSWYIELNYSCAHEPGHELHLTGPNVSLCQASSWSFLGILETSNPNLLNTKLIHQCAIFLMHL